MKRLTPDLIMRSPAFRNALNERELDLRGHRIPRIENLGVTQDQFDTIDLSNNNIEVLEDFPIFTRCTTLLLNSNIVKRIDDSFHTSLPNIETMILTNNKISSFTDIKSLQNCGKLKRLSLYMNPITGTENYRLIAIRLFPQVQFLDFQRVTEAERKASLTVFQN